MPINLDADTLSQVVAEILDLYTVDDHVQVVFDEEVEASSGSSESLAALEKLGRALGEVLFQQQLRITVGDSASTLSKDNCRQLFDSVTLRSLVVYLGAMNRDLGRAFVLERAPKKMKPLVDSAIEVLEGRCLIPVLTQRSTATVPAPATEDERILEFWGRDDLEQSPVWQHYFK